MNTSTLNTFARETRTQLHELISARLLFWLGSEGGKKPDSAEHRQYAPQIKELEGALRREGKEALVERVAYTWFNRLAALRFMDARGYHPFGARVLTPASAGDTLPELFQQARSGSLDASLQAHIGNLSLFNDLLSGKISVSQPEAQIYRLLLLSACHYYHEAMPFLFEKLGDATELLLPDDLLTEHSVVHAFRAGMEDADCQEVEVLGWLYQFYISEKKDAVMARKSAVPTEDIPAVTQLFTPHWIVRYLVENSLGRLWLLNRPGSRLREHMPYYIEGEPETDFLKITKPEEIRLCDPAVGSGHMLTYAFDLLTLIYEEEGYAPTEIPALILKNNLHGLEICPRAAQLAELALVFKAREKSRRFFQPEHLVRPHIMELQDVRFAEGELSSYFKALGEQPSNLHPQLAKLLHQFEDSKNLGSLIQPCLTEAEIQSVRSKIENPQSKIGNGDLMVAATHLKVLRVLEQAEALTQRYHVVVANPPYMGLRGMDGPLKGFMEDNYPEAKHDLYTGFIDRNGTLALTGGYIGMVTMQGWLFLSSFISFRAKLFNASAFINLAQLGARAFDSIGGEVVQTACFTICNAPDPNFRATYLDVTKGQSEAEKDAYVRSSPHKYHVAVNDLRKVEGTPVAYWLSEKARDAFASGCLIRDVAKPRQGLATSDNDRFLRYWNEVEFKRIGLGISTRTDAKQSGRKWFPLAKGGAVRKWYGNNEYVVNWEDDGREMLGYAAKLYGSPTRTVKNMDFYFREGITWSTISNRFSMRFSAAGAISETKGAMCFADSKDDLIYLLGFSNSCLVESFLKVFSPTLDFHEGPFGKLPFIKSSESDTIKTLSNECVSLARADWDNFETSWDFRDQPLLRPGLKGATLEASWRNWEAQSTAAIRRMQALETENNRLFIAAYGLEGELQPEVPEAQITLARAEARRDMAAFLSYAVGCMMGRYGLDHPGLILANAGDTLREFLEKVGKPLAELTFAPDEDGIIPVLDGEWFEDDIVARTRDFLRATYGEATLGDNLRFIEDSLGKELRKYFARDFYKDHLQTYKKRPIYWLVQSPNGSFEALLYLHRYTKDTVNLLLNEYVRTFLGKLESRHKHLTAVTLDPATRPGDKTKAAKDLTKISKMIKEIHAWEREVVLPLAQKRIEIDLDDGVKTNYLKFPGLLAPIAGLEKKEED